jgi:hypothetical protein
MHSWLHDLVVDEDPWRFPNSKYNDARPFGSIFLNMYFNNVIVNDCPGIFQLKNLFSNKRK